jgi:SsrA-binding protein
MPENANKSLAENRRAFHDYEIIDTLEAGLSLLGTEVKSIRTHGASLQEAYVTITEKNQAILKNATIAQYKFGNIHNHEEKRDRLLLLHKREIQQLKQKVQEKGLTLIPLSLYLSRGMIKLKIGVAKGKKNYDKRQALKEKEDKRSMQRALKQASE